VGKQAPPTRAAPSLVRALRDARGALLFATGTSLTQRPQRGPFCMPIRGPFCVPIDSESRANLTSSSWDVGIPTAQSAWDQDGPRRAEQVQQRYRWRFPSASIPMSFGRSVTLYWSFWQDAQPASELASYYPTISGNQRCRGPVEHWVWT